MFPFVVLAIVVIALIVIGVLVYWILAGISAANDAAGYLARPFDSSIGSSGGLIGGEKALGEIVPLGALALLVGGIGATVYLMGASGIVMLLAAFVLLIDAIAIYLAVLPDNKNEDFKRLSGNRGLFLLDMFLGVLLYVLGTAAFYIAGFVPSIVGPWVYAGAAIEVFVVLLCCSFQECYNRDPQKYDWKSWKARIGFSLRNLVLVAIAIVLVSIVAIGFAPTANTYAYLMATDNGEAVGIFGQTMAIFFSLGAFTITMPTAPLWVPIYWLGFEKGAIIWAVELFMIVLLSQMDKRKK